MLELSMLRLRQGDNAALADIYKLTDKSVFSICFTTVRDYQLAEDLMQDTYLAVKRNIMQYRLGTNAAAWINTIARNISLNEIKRRKREVSVDFSEREDIRGAYEVRARDESGIIGAVMKTLNANESGIVLMHTLGGIALKEIAALTDKPEGTVRWEYNNALKKLRKILKREEL